MQRSLINAVLLSTLCLLPATAEAQRQKAWSSNATKTPAAKPAAQGLNRRIEQIEEQLVDLQVAIGTLESLARPGGSGAPQPTGGVRSGSFTGPQAGRVAALETQVQALTAQIEQMRRQISAFQAGAAPPAVKPRAGGYNSLPRGPVATPSGGFRTTTVKPATGNDPIGNLISRDNQPPTRSFGSRVASSPPLVSAASQQSYETAYGHLLQQNYGAAEAGFRDFLRQHPSGALAANAQFWLGETYFVRGQWDQAADAFLRVAKNHAGSDKAPDSLAKLAMAMGRKGNNRAACRALAELKARFPNPPSHVKRWEAAERRRAGCG